MTPPTRGLLIPMRPGLRSINVAMAAAMALGEALRQTGAHMKQLAHDPPTDTASKIALSVPPQMWFVVSAIFHYLGPAFAALLFAQVGVLGVAWFRIASAAAIFAIWTKPWRLLRTRAARDPHSARAARRVPRDHEFHLLSRHRPPALEPRCHHRVSRRADPRARGRTRMPRNLAAVALAGFGVYLQTKLHWSSDLLGFSMRS